MTIDAALQRAAADAARGIVNVPAELHGFPGTAHGGAVAAVFHRLALPRVPVELRVELLRGVPTATPLGLRTGSSGATARLALHQGDRPLAQATLRREDLLQPDIAPLRARWAADHAGGTRCPVPPAVSPADRATPWGSGSASG